jgi:hypothetical protein
VKFWYVAVAFLFIQCGPVSAEGQNCAADYYRTKLPSCVDSMLSQLRQMATSGKAEPNTIIGFLAQLFSTSPAERQRILDAEPSDYVRSVDLMALYRAGLPDDARKFADKNQLSAVLQKLETTRPALLAAVRPSTIPADNDLLIGAYMASGDTTFIDRILGNFSGADDSLVSDAFRMGFMLSKFGPGFGPKGRENIMSPAACAKYQCKADPAKFFRVLTLSSAFWALQSLAQHDNGINKTLAGFVDRDSRLKGLLAAEQAAFGNYVAALAMFAAFGNDHTSTETGQAYEAMSKAASAYENLEPAANVFSHIEALAKSGKKPN